MTELQNDTMRIIFAARGQNGRGHTRLLRPDSPSTEFDCLQLASLICKSHQLEDQGDTVHQRQVLRAMDHDRLVEIIMAISERGGASLEDADLDRFLIRTS